MASTWIPQGLSIKKGTDHPTSPIIAVLFCFIHLACMQKFNQRKDSGGKQC